MLLGGVQLIYNVLKFSATGDGVTDDTAAIQSAIDYVAALPNGGEVYVPNGTYKVVAPSLYGAALTMKSNVTLHLATNATIQLSANNFDECYVVGLSSIANARIKGGKIYGDRVAHTGETGEWGHGIFIADSENIIIDGTAVYDCWGDGIYVGTYTEVGYAQSVVIKNFSIDNCRRNGISVISAKQLTIQDGDITNIDGADPQCGIDFEPDYATQFLQGITVKNLNITGCTHLGVLFAYGIFKDTANNSDVTLDNVSTSGNGERYNFYKVYYSPTADYGDYRKFIQYNNKISINIINADYVPAPASKANIIPALTSIDDWEAAASTLATSDGIVSVTGSGSSQYINAYCNSSVDCTTGHLIYIKATVKVTNAICEGINLGIGGTSSWDYNTPSGSDVATPAQNTEYTIYGIHKLTAESTGDICAILGRHNYSSSANANGKVLQILSAECCDLTAEFCGGVVGTELEPDAVWCASNLTFSPYVAPPITLTNLINGSMSSSADWNVSNSANISVTGGEGIVTATGQYGGIKSDVFSVVSGHVYYFRVMIKGSNANILSLAESDDGSDYMDSDYISGSGVYEISSFVTTAILTANDFIISVIDGRSSNWNEFRIKEVMVIDLTASYGAGHEPLIAVCNAWAWFNGSIEL